MKMLDSIDMGESPKIYGDGSEAFDFVAVEDCARANICAMKSEANDSFYNVGTGKRTSLKELAEIIIELTNTNKKIEYQERSQATLVKNRIGCPKKAQNEIGYSSKIKLKEGLQKLIDWRNGEIKRSRFNYFFLLMINIPIARTSLTEKEINSVS